MPETQTDNLTQPLLTEDWLLGEVECLCQRLVWPVASPPERLIAVTAHLARSASDTEAAAGTMRVTLGRTAFGSDLGEGLLHPDWLVPNALLPQTVRFNALLSGLTVSGGNRELYLTLYAPRQARRVQTGHVASGSGIVSTLQARTDGTITNLGHPLALSVTTQRHGASLTSDVTALPAADHSQFDTWIAGGHMRKRTRVTLWQTDFGLKAPPFFAESDLPTVNNPVALRAVESYQVTTTDRFTAATLTMILTLPEYQFHQDRLTENVMITVDERWGDGDSRTGWLRRGTFFLDHCVDSLDAAGNRTVTVEARDALKLLMVGKIDSRFWPDKLFVPRKRLRKIRDGFATNLPYHVFIDGDEDSSGKITKTVMWVARPEVKLWKKGDRAARIALGRGSVDVIHRNGELWIEREFYHAPTNYAGLGNPDWIEAEYWRYALPTDEVLTRVRSISGNRLTLATPHPASWRGVSVLVLSGAKRGLRLQITAVAADGGSVRCSNQDALMVGIAPGDLVQVVVANRIEAVVREIMLQSGFQDLSPAYPFYIEDILPPPTANIVTLPADEEFDFRYEKAKSGFDILQEAAKWLPPNCQYKANALGNIDTVIFNPATAPTYDARASLSQVRSTLDDSQTFTRVRYRVRDRRYLNLIGQTSPHLVAVRVNNEMVGLGSLTMLDVATVFPTNWLGNLTSKGERIARALSDGVRGSGVTWQIVLNRDSDAAPDDSLRAHMNGKWLVEWELDQAYKLKEIHIRGNSEKWITDEHLEIQVSEDGVTWEVATDEFTFENEDAPYQTFDLGDNNLRARFLRVICTWAPLLKTTKSQRSLIPKRKTAWSEAVSFADLFVYADDVIEGVAELGVDRLDGETDAQFDADKALRAKLGLRTFVVEPLDEQGFEISIAKGMTLEQYAKARAIEYLAEVVNDFRTVTISGERPDLSIGDMPAFPVPALALPNASYVVREVTVDDQGRVQGQATDYRYQGVGVGSLDNPPSTGTVAAIGNDGTSTVEDWDGVFTP